MATAKMNRKTKERNFFLNRMFMRKSLIITGVTLFTCLLTFNYKYYEVLSLYMNDLDISQSTRWFWTRLLFGRMRSKVTGKLFDIEVPPFCRSFIYNFAIKVFDVNKEEIKYPIESYKSFSDFFSRQIREDKRPIDPIGEHSLVSPCDSKIIDFGEIKSNSIYNVKGLNININHFIGGELKKKYTDNSTKLYFAIFYLSPRMYHRFHAPVDFAYKIRRHISGELFPVFNGMFKFINNLFNINERVILLGEWKGGSMYYAAVGAYNVGNIKITNDWTLSTNKMRTQLSYLGGDIDTAKYEENKLFRVGDEIGEFRLGSTIVLIFENKKFFKWNIKHDQYIKVGQKIGGIDEQVKEHDTKYIRYR